MTVEAPARIAKPAIITPKGGVRCWCCGMKFMNQITAPYDHDCRHCKAKNKDAATEMTT